MYLLVFEFITYVRIFNSHCKPRNLITAYEKWQILPSIYFFLSALLSSAVFLFGFVNSAKSGLCPNCLIAFKKCTGNCTSLIPLLLLFSWWHFPFCQFSCFPPSDFNCWLFRISQLWFDEGANRVIASLIHSYCSLLSPSRATGRVWLDWTWSGEYYLGRRRQPTFWHISRGLWLTEDNTSPHGSKH